MLRATSEALVDSSPQCLRPKLYALSRCRSTATNVLFGAGSSIAPSERDEVSDRSRWRISRSRFHDLLKSFSRKSSPTRRTGRINFLPELREPWVDLTGKFADLTDARKSRYRWMPSQHTRRKRSHSPHESSSCRYPLHPNLLVVAQSGPIFFSKIQRSMITGGMFTSVVDLR